MSSLNLNDPQKSPYRCGGMGDFHHYVQPTNLQNVSDAIMSLWTRIPDEYFRHPAESTPWGIKALVQAKRWSKPVLAGCTSYRVQWVYIFYLTVTTGLVTDAVLSLASSQCAFLCWVVGAPCAVAQAHTVSALLWMTDSLDSCWQD